MSGKLRKSSPFKFNLLIVLLFCLSTVVSAASFEVKDIRVEGLQRVSPGTVFSAFPINVGDTVDDDQLAAAAHRLFATGLFTNMRLGVDDQVLVIDVKERPSISKIEITGNKAISKENLKKGLKSAGINEGQVFKRATLERLELEIQRSYVAQGRYNATVTGKVEHLSRNRVSIKLEINEGKIANIQHINFVGNHAFSNKDLRDLMELKTPGLWSFITSDDKYTKEKMSGDLERIRSFYLNQGFIKFAFESTQISISRDKKDVYISISLSEGPKYTIRDVQLKGKLIVPEAELKKLITIKPGDTFSQQKLTNISNLISKRLGKEGYTFANVNAVPETHKDNTASITFYVDPGRRTYVRRINFRGNINTSDEVLRQEMRQMEGGAASSDLIEASKVRLERLGFFKSVNVETPSVPGHSDQVDVNYHVEEQSSGNLSASLGYSQSNGFILGLSVAERNFMGSGRNVSFSVNNSKVVKSANFSYLNPYYTVDGVSRGFDLFAKKTDFSQQTTSSSYVLDNYGGDLTFGYPINNISRLSFSFGVDNTHLKVGDFPVTEITKFTDIYGFKYNAFRLAGSWTRSTLNKGLMPTNGWYQRLKMQVTTPGLSDLEFFKSSYKTDYYFPVDKKDRWVVHLRTELAYANSYGTTKTLPFFENYYAGGISSVRGYQSNSLGKKGTNQPLDFSSPTSFGGNILTTGSLEFILPIPFVKDQRSMRMMLFVDGGNVFDSNRGYNPSLKEMRMSAGWGFQWITAIGPIGFSLAKAFNDQPGDQKQFFQFTLGQPF
jgi:outer membrane protein insertion porin family